MLETKSLLPLQFTDGYAFGQAPRLYDFLAICANKITDGNKELIIYRKAKMHFNLPPSAQEYEASECFAGFVSSQDS